MVVGKKSATKKAVPKGGGNGSSKKQAAPSEYVRELLRELRDAYCEVQLSHSDWVRSVILRLSEGEQTRLGEECQTAVATFVEVLNEIIRICFKPETIRSAKKKGVTTKPIEGLGRQWLRRQRRLAASNR